MGRNVAFDLRRRSDRRRRADDTGIRSDAPVTPEREFEQREIRDLLHAALGALPRRRRDVFELTWMRGLSYSEAADVLGIAPQTVANLISLTLRDLRSLLSGLDPDAPAQPRREPREEVNGG
jgi:RNA polymerase sigma-70 factor (ECF subfamily)